MIHLEQGPQHTYENTVTAGESQMCILLRQTTQKVLRIYFENSGPLAAPQGGERFWAILGDFGCIMALFDVFCPKQGHCNKAVHNNWHMDLVCLSHAN